MLSAFGNGQLFGVATGSRRPTVLALHGWGRSSADFAATLRDLDAIALDLPGFGATPAPPDAWGGAEYAKAVAEVLADMATPVVVLGHSFGGRIAVHLAAAHPEAVEGLVLTGAPLVRVPGAAARRPAVGYRVGRALHRRHLFPDSRMEALRRRYGSRDYLAAVGVMRGVHVRVVNETYEDQLAAVACPVELVWGDDDGEVALAVAEEAQKLFRRASLTVVPGAGHLTPLTAPDALSNAVLRVSAAKGRDAG